MVLAAKTKRPTTSIKHKKRYGEHHHHTKHYLQPYWPYLPILVIIGLGMSVNNSLSNKHSQAAPNQISSVSLLSDTNTARLKNNETGLSLSAQLTSAANAEANTIVEQNAWSNSKTVGSVLPGGTVEGQYSSLSQSLAYGFSSPSNLLAAWLSNSRDQATILNNNFAQVGYGIAQSANFIGKGPTAIIVAIYGQPQIDGVSGAQLINFKSPSKNVSRVELLTNNYSSGLIIAITVLVFGSLAAFVVRHGIAWKKVFKYGEKFSVEHPWIDIFMVTIITTAFVLNHTIAAII
jgi:uncharacterized protein YkwD